MREDILRIYKMIWQRKVKIQGQRIDFNWMLTFCKIRKRRRGLNITKIVYSETRENMKNFDI